MRKRERRIEYSRKFIKQLQKAPLSIKEVFRKKLEISLSDPFQQQLNNHSLSGSLRSFRSINITGDWRAIYQEIDDTVTFFLLGTHSQLYK